MYQQYPQMIPNVANGYYNYPNYNSTCPNYATEQTKTIYHLVNLNIQMNLNGCKKTLINMVLL